MSWWLEEMKRLGTKRMLLSRLKFHHRLSVEEVSRETGLSMITVRRHFRKLVDLGLAEWGTKWSDGLGAVNIRLPSGASSE